MNFLGSSEPLRINYFTCDPWIVLSDGFLSIGTNVSLQSLSLSLNVIDTIFAVECSSELRSKELGNS